MDTIVLYGEGKSVNLNLSDHSLLQYDVQLNPKIYGIAWYIGNKKIDKAIYKALTDSIRNLTNDCTEDIINRRNLSSSQRTTQNTSNIKSLTLRINFANFIHDNIFDCNKISIVHEILKLGFDELRIEFENYVNSICSSVIRYLLFGSNSKSRYVENETQPNLKIKHLSITVPKNIPVDLNPDPTISEIGKSIGNSILRRKGVCPVSVFDRIQRECAEKRLFLFCLSQLSLRSLEIDSLFINNNRDEKVCKCKINKCNCNNGYNNGYFSHFLEHNTHIKSLSIVNMSYKHLNILSSLPVYENKCIKKLIIQSEGLYTSDITNFIETNKNFPKLIMYVDYVYVNVSITIHAALKYNNKIEKFVLIRKMDEKENIRFNRDIKKIIKKNRTPFIERYSDIWSPNYYRYMVHQSKDIINTIMMCSVVNSDLIKMPIELLCLIFSYIPLFCN